MSRLRRLLSRPSSRLVRSILIPLTVIQLALTVYFLFLSNRAAESLAYDRIEGMAQAFAMSETPTSGTLRRAADWIEAERIWIVSATGRIVGSSIPEEIEGLIEDIWWQDLPTDSRRVRSMRERGGQEYVQVSYHDIERGVWAIIVADTSTPILAGSARWGAILLLSLSIWLLMSGAVAWKVNRSLGRALDVSDLIARRALQGQAASTTSLARLRAVASGYGPAQLVLQLVERMQERATRTNEAETRFGLAIELLPGIAYLASYDGAILYAGPLLRQRLGADGVVGQAVDSIPDLPLERVHTAAKRSFSRGVTFDNLPVAEATPERGALRASMRAVVFRGLPAYLAHIEAVTDSGETTRLPGRQTDFYPQVVEGASELILAFDGATRTLVWNAAAARFTGTPQDRVPDLRAAIEELFQGGAAMEAFARWMDGNPEQEPLELESMAANGTPHRIVWTAVELKDGDQTIGGALFGSVLPPITKVTDRRALGTKKRTRVARPSEPIAPATVEESTAPTPHRGEGADGEPTGTEIEPAVTERGTEIEPTGTARDTENAEAGTKEASDAKDGSVASG